MTCIIQIVTNYLEIYVVKPFLLSCPLALLLATATGCVGGDSDFQEGKGKAEAPGCFSDQVAHEGDCLRPDQICTGDLVMINGACHPEEVQLTLHMISGKLTTEDVFSGETWDDKDAADSRAQLPDAVVDIIITDPDTGETVNSGVSPVEPDDDQPRWEEGPIEKKRDRPLVISLDNLTSPYNVVRVRDDDQEINNNLLGECTLNPTEVELAEGIIKVKNCATTLEKSTVTVRKEGDKSNILELLIGVAEVVPESAP